MANLYFLMLTFLKFMPAVYYPGGPASMYLPLMFVVSVSMIKDAIEDRSRYKSDCVENLREAF
jgi:phospholipid-transporting ATPase